MDEGRITRTKKSTKEEVISEKQPGSFGRKLKNESTRNEAMRKKLRNGKANNTESLADNKNKMQMQQRRKLSATDVTVSRAVHGQVNASNQDQNAGIDAVDTGVSITEGGIYSIKQSSKSKNKSGYSGKIHNKRQDESKGEVKVTSKEIQKNRMKKEIQTQAFNERNKKAANGIGNISRKFVDKAEDLVGKIGETVKEALESHPLITILVLGIVLLIMVGSSVLSSLVIFGGGLSTSTLSSTYTAEDDEIKKVDDDYKALEKSIKNKIDNIKNEYPGKDEYQINCDQVGHNPFELAALLTVLYEDYTEAEVQSKLEEIKDMQYELTIQEITEKRKKTETRWHWVTKYKYEVVNGVLTQIPYQVYESYEVEVEYDYYILKVTLVNHSIDYVARNILNADQLARYELLLTTYGNKKYLFEDDGYSVPNPGDYEDYHVPSEYLTDEQFGRMLHEAEKYLGYPYVWGGSSPSTSFDCSGFVSWVINNCGNGWNIGRLTCDGILNCCTIVPPDQAKPGDLIFFEKTYDVSGTSHVGIYVGDGMMIHCGNPIQYTSVNTSYWQSHFYCYARIKH